MPEQKNNSLCKRYSGSFRIGVAVDYERCQNYHDIISRHFNSITPENDMKFEVIHPNKNVFAWERMDDLSKYAMENKCSVRGHTLLWHEQIPEWVKNYDGNVKYLRRIMCNHIMTIVDRYKNIIDSWDVINEAFSDDNREIFRKTLWFNAMGEKFIDYAFMAAKEAAPNGLFFLNDYNGHIVSKRNKMVSFIDAMKKRGISLDGIGIQGHYNIYFPSLDMIKSELEEYARRGLRIQITELDISLFDFHDHRVDLLQPTKEMVKRQKEMYYNLFSLYEKYKDYISSVTFWGVADDHTWLDSYPIEGRKDWPLLFDEKLQEKQVLQCLLGEKDVITSK